VSLEKIIATAKTLASQKRRAIRKYRNRTRKAVAPKSRFRKIAWATNSGARPYSAVASMYSEFGRSGKSRRTSESNAAMEATPTSTLVASITDGVQGRRYWLRPHNNA